MPRFEKRNLAYSDEHSRCRSTLTHVLAPDDPDEAGQEVRILQTIESGLQPTDLLGRYGSRQLLVLIPVGRAEGGPFLATGFRKDLAAAGVRAALGCATTGDAELEGLLIEAMSDVMSRRAAAGITRNW